MKKLIVPILLFAATLSLLSIDSDSKSLSKARTLNSSEPTDQETLQLTSQTLEISKEKTQADSKQFDNERVLHQTHRIAKENEQDSTEVESYEFIESNNDSGDGIENSDYQNDGQGELTADQPNCQCKQNTDQQSVDYGYDSPEDMSNEELIADSSCTEDEKTITLISWENDKVAEALEKLNHLTYAVDEETQTQRLTAEEAELFLQTADIAKRMFEQRKNYKEEGSLKWDLIYSFEAPNPDCGCDPNDEQCLLDSADEETSEFSSDDSLYSTDERKRRLGHKNIKARLNIRKAVTIHRKSHSNFQPIKQKGFTYRDHRRLSIPRQNYSRPINKHHYSRRHRQLVRNVPNYAHQKHIRRLNPDIVITYELIPDFRQTLDRVNTTYISLFDLLPKQKSADELRDTDELANSVENFSRIKNFSTIFQSKRPKLDQELNHLNDRFSLINSRVETVFNFFEFDSQMQKIHMRESKSPLMVEKEVKLSELSRQFFNKITEIINQITILLSSNSDINRVSSQFADNGDPSSSGCMLDQATINAGIAAWPSLIQTEKQARLSLETLDKNLTELESFRTDIQKLIDEMEKISLGIKIDSTESGSSGAGILTRVVTAAIVLVFTVIV